jgi:type IV secretory pathway VirB10-like protein
MEHPHTTTHRKQAHPKYWSQDVTEHSDAMDLDQGVFKLRSARQIAESIKHSADRSHRRKASPFQSAMSMLNFYLNRAGKNLSASRKRTLTAAKRLLRRLYGRA